jgi:DNA topoisomerase IA
MNLFLCEKPSQAKDITNAIGARNRGYACISGDVGFAYLVVVID